MLWSIYGGFGISGKATDAKIWVEGAIARGLYVGYCLRIFMPCQWWWLNWGGKKWKEEWEENELQCEVELCHVECHNWSLASCEPNRELSMLKRWFLVDENGNGVWCLYIESSSYDHMDRYIVFHLLRYFRSFICAMSCAKRRWGTLENFILELVGQ